MTPLGYGPGGTFQSQTIQCSVITVWKFIIIRTKDPVTFCTVPRNVGSKSWIGNTDDQSHSLMMLFNFRLSLLIIKISFH